MTVTIDVTQDDIDYGTGSFSNCPIARAVKRIIRSRLECMVTDCELGLYSDIFILVDSFRLPDTASAFIVDFDRKKPVAPFSFKLNVPERFLRLPVAA